MKKIFLLDTNISSKPIHDAFINDGHQVFVIGGNPNDYLAKVSGNYINQDYSKIEEVERLMALHEIDYVVPGCNDLSYEICSKINASKPNVLIDTPEVSEIINNKKAFRKFSMETGLPIPKFFSATDELKWPVIVKPVDAYSGRGVTVLQHSEEALLDEAIQKAKSFSKSGEVVVEEFVDGQLYSHSAFIRNQAIVADFIVIEHGTASAFAVDTSRVVYDFPPETLSAVRDSINKMCRDLNLVDGLVHTQFIKKDEAFWIIEITRRCPGDLYSQLIELSTGFPYAKTYADFFIKEDVPVQAGSLKANHILRHTISDTKDRFFSNLQFNLEIKIEQLIILVTSGDWIRLNPFGRIGIIFISANSAAELATIFDKTLERKLYTIN